MAGDPAADADTDGRQFLLASFWSDPHARQAGHATRLDAKARGGAHQRFFEIADISMDIAAIGPQVEDGIADELAWTVIRDVATAAGLVDGHARAGELFRRC